MPRARFSGVAVVDQRQQGEGGVTNPAIAIVPVTRAADLLGERCRRSRDDAARRRIRERLQRDERTLHDVAVFADAGGLRGPLAPELLGLLQCMQWIDRLWHFMV